MEDKIKLKLNERLKSARLYKGMSQKELAKSVGVSQARISEYEKGTRTPKPLRLKMIANALKLDLLFDYGNEYFYDRFMRDTPEDDIERDQFNDWQEYSAKEDAETIFKYGPWEIDSPPVEEQEINYEDKLLISFKELNETGQRKAVAYTADLTKIPEYRKDK